MANGEDQFFAALSRISRTKSLSGLRKAVMDGFAQVGFNAAYFLAPVVDDPSIGRTLTNLGFPRKWADGYMAGGVLLDPLPRLALTRNRALIWPDELRAADLKRKEADYLASLAVFGMERGIAVPCYGPFARAGFVAVGAPAGEDCFTEGNRIRVEVCAQLSFRRYGSISRPFSSDAPGLSAREMEVLRWIAEGKSNSTIADILEIATATVDEYVRRLFDKLNVADRTSAALKALALGLVVVGRFPGKAR